MHRSSLFLAVLVGGFAFTSLASAQVGGSDMRIGAGMVLDFGGEAEIDVGPGPDTDDDTKLTPGFRLHLDYDVHRYISVGGLLRFGWWRADDFDQGRNMLVDIVARVNGHYDWHDFRFYVAVGIGPTFDRLNDDNRGGLDNPGAGVAASIAPGFEWWMIPQVGLFTEIFGWSGHFVRHGTDGPGKTRIALNQVVLQLGAVFAL